jgi:hypothetical protein
MIKLLIGLIPFFVLIPLNCTSPSAITRDILPGETYDSRIQDEKCAIILSRNFDISCDEIKPDKLESILKNSHFLNKDSKTYIRQMTKYNIFRIVIENTGNSPLEIGELNLKYGASIIKPLSADDLQNKIHNSAIDFNEFLNLHKLDANDICENDIDFQRDIIINTEDRINPGDKALLFAVFDWIPVQIRKFNISVAIKSEISQKTIDFKLRRFEYRQSGKDFIKPEQDDNN